MTGTINGAAFRIRSLRSQEELRGALSSATAVASLLGISPGALSRLDHLNPLQRQRLHQQIGPHLEEFLSLASETDPRMFASGMLNLGMRLEHGDHLEMASAIYSFLATAQPSIPSTDLHQTRESAQARLDAMTGVGSSGLRAEFLTRRLAREAMEPTTLFGMGVASAAFRITRLAALSRIAASPAAGFWSRGFGARATASLLGFGVEGAVFPMATRLGNVALGRPLDWSGGQIGREVAGSYLVLGALKLCGWGAAAGFNRVNGWNSAVGARHAVPLRGLFGQAGMLGGIFLGHQAETALGLRPQLDGATTWVDSLAMLFQFNVAGNLTRHAFGERFHRWERELELSTATLGTPLDSAPRRSQGEIHPSLQWAGALAAGNPQEGRIVHPRSAQSNLILMSSSDDTGGKIPEPASAELPRSTASPIEESLQNLLGISSQAVGVFELPVEGGLGPIIWSNRRWSEILRYTPGEILGRSPADFLLAESLPIFQRKLENVAAGGKFEILEIPMRRKDGNQVMTNLYVGVEAREEKRLGFLFVEDISEQLHIVEDLLKNEARYTAFLKAIPDVLYLIDRDGTYLDVHTERPQELLYPPQKMIGMRIQDLRLPPALTNIWLQGIHRALKSGHTQIVEYTLPVKGGQDREQEARVVAIDENLVVAIVRDITDQKAAERERENAMKRTQEQRIAEEKLETLRRIGQAIAHDGNNALSILVNYVPIVHRSLSEVRLLSQWVRDVGGRLPAENFIAEFSERLSALEKHSWQSMSTADVPELGRRSTEVLDPLIGDLEAMDLSVNRLQNLLGGFRNLTADPVIGPPFELRTALDPLQIQAMIDSREDPAIRPQLEMWIQDSAFVPGPREKIEGVIENLVLNAAEALRAQPDQLIRIETSKLHLSPQLLQAIPPEFLSANVQPGDFIRVRVEDNGPGMTESIRQRIFEIFFSTKPKWESSSGPKRYGGSGLGLWSAKRFVEAAGGFITVESTPGEGTRIDVYLPETTVKPLVLDPAVRRQIRSTPVLLVEAERELQEMIPKGLLGNEFTQVLVAASAEEALTILEANPEIGMILTEARLSGSMTGMQLVRHLKEARPDLPLVLFIGTASSAYDNFMGERGAVVEKPVTVNQLIATIEGLLVKTVQK